MQILQLLLLAFLSGLMMFFGWPNYGFFPLLFVGLVPVFFGLNIISKWDVKRWKKSIIAFLFVGISHGLFVGLSSYWLKTTSPKTWLIGVVLSVLTAGFFLFLSIFSNSKRNPYSLILSFGSLWILMEYFNQHWMIGSPYFILGSGFGMYPKFIQFYSLVGVEGGTIWVLLSNGFMFLALEKWISKNNGMKYLFIALGVTLIPITSSLLVSMGNSSQSTVIVGVLHTYFDPYQKIMTDEGTKAVDYLVDQSEKKTLQQLDLLIWPETAIANIGWHSNLNQEKTVEALLKWKNNYPKLTVSTGGYAFSLDESLDENPYARYVQEGDYSYETHNVSLTISDNQRIWLRSKEMFVPFQERIPFLHTFPWLVNFADYVGSNTMVSFREGTQQIHFFRNGKYTFTPVLCYESIYPLFMAEKAKNNHLIVIQANELWNKNPYGSQQYLYNSVVMAVQSKMPILRSSNNGMSAIIDADGTILDQSKNKNNTLLIQQISLNEDGSFYLSIRGYSLALAIVGLFIFFFHLFKNKNSVKF